MLKESHENGEGVLVMLGEGDLTSGTDEVGLLAHEGRKVRSEVLAAIGKSIFMLLARRRTFR